LTEIEDTLITHLRSNEGKTFLEQLVDIYVKSENKEEFEELRYVAKMLSKKELPNPKCPIKILSDSQLEIINSKLKEGYNLAIIGQTGSGKTTALKNILESQPLLRYIIASESIESIPLRDDCINKEPLESGHVPALDSDDAIFLMKNKEARLILDGTVRNESDIAKVISTLNYGIQTIFTMHCGDFPWKEKMKIICEDTFTKNWIQSNIIDDSAKYKFLTVKTFIHPVTKERTAEIL